MWPIINSKLHFLCKTGKTSKCHIIYAVIQTSTVNIFLNELRSEVQSVCCRLSRPLVFLTIRFQKKLRYHQAAVSPDLKMK
jgi:hypothetical protein